MLSRNSAHALWVRQVSYNEDTCHSRQILIFLSIYLFYRPVYPSITTITNSFIIYRSNLLETSIEKLPHNSSSAETISEEQEPVRETSSWRTSPSTSSSSRLSSPRTSECYCLTPSSSSNCVTASPSRGRSPECYRETSTSNQSTFVSLTPPRERYPEHNRKTSSSNSTHVTPPPRERSPAHRCLTPSPCVTPTSSRGQSPDPSFLRNVQSCSSFADDQEICNQSSEYTQSNDPVPISVEAHDIERDQEASKSTRKDTSSAPGKRKQSRSVVRRNSPSPKRGVDCVPSYELKMKEISFPKQTGDADKNVPPISNSDRGQGHNVMATNDNDMNQANIAGKIKNNNLSRLDTLEVHYGTP